MQIVLSFANVLRQFNRLQRNIQISSNYQHPYLGANYKESRNCDWTTYFRKALLVGLFQYKKFYFDLDYTCLLRKLSQLGNSKPTQIIKEEFST